jgi:hypothetical protein
MKLEGPARRTRRWASALLLVLVGVVGVPTLASAQARPLAPHSATVVCGGKYGSSLARLQACLRLTSHSSKRPKAPPRGATALCRDHTYSFSHSRWVACRGHGGVRRWLRR